MSLRVAVFLAVAMALGSGSPAGAEVDGPPRIVWEDNDDRPIPEPSVDEEGDLVWWDHAEKLSAYQIRRVADLGNVLHGIGRGLGLADPREARNVNTLDEVPDSTWFTNRHHLRPLPPEELARGPNRGPPPADEGPLRVVSAWENVGLTFGIVVVDREDRKYVVKFDPPELLELSTSSEVVASKIFHALGWNVPEYHLDLFHPERLEVAPDATIQDEYNQKRRMTKADLDRLLGRSARLPDGRLRASASRFISGTPKGPPAMEGVRPDDPNDTIPHEDRRDLRGLHVVSAWVHYTDARRGNLYDTFVQDPDAPEGHGHLVHYVLDFGTTFGSDQTRWKPPRFGHEYFFDPWVVLRRLVSLGFWVQPWEDSDAPAHPELGYFRAADFDPQGWKAFYPNPLFDQATHRDLFWGAKLVASLEGDDVRTIVAMGEWSDPDAEEALVRILLDRRRRIAAEFFDADRINPADRFDATGGQLTFDDLAVATEVAPAERARYRFRGPGGAWTVTSRPAADVSREARETKVELQTSHDGGRSWSPSTIVSLWHGEGASQVIGIDRTTR